MLSIVRYETVINDGWPPPDSGNMDVVINTNAMRISKVTATVSKSVLINGNMYEDDFTMDSMG